MRYGSGFSYVSRNSFQRLRFIIKHSAGKKIRSAVTVHYTHTMEWNVIIKCEIRSGQMCGDGWGSQVRVRFHPISFTVCITFDAQIEEETVITGQLPHTASPGIPSLQQEIDGQNFHA